nr:unnamed protein product [Callosobruchus chinensis]
MVALITKCWNFANIEEQRVFIAFLMKEPKYSYALHIDQQKGKTRIRLSTEFFTSNVISKRARGDCIPHETKNDVRAHIASITRIDSHHTRAQKENILEEVRRSLICIETLENGKVRNANQVFTPSNRKNLNRREEQADKDKENDKYQACSFDLQAVLPVPQGKWKQLLILIFEVLTKI